MSGNLVETLVGAVVLLVAGFFLYFSYDKADAGTVSGYALIAKFDTGRITSDCVGSRDGVPIIVEGITHLRHLHLGLTVIP